MKNYYYYLAITALLIIIVFAFNQCNAPDVMSQKPAYRLIVARI